MEKKDFEKFVKEYNLVTTDVLSVYDSCKVGFNIDNYNVNYEESVSLIELVQKFNELYNRFKKKIGKIEKIKLDNKEEFVFNHYSFSPDNSFKVLTFYNYINDGVNFEPYADKKLMLLSCDGKYSYKMITCEKNQNKDISSMIIIKEELIKKYFSIIEEFELLFDAYIKLKNGFIFEDGANILTTKIIGDNIFSSLEEFSIAFGIHSWAFFKLHYKLDDNFTKIDENTITEYVDEQPLEITEIDSLTKKLRIHKKYLPNLYK